MPELFGIGIEVYFIVVVAFISIYFLWRWIFRKSRHKTSTKVVIWIGTMLSTPLIYFLLLEVTLFIYAYYPNRDFDKKEWFANKQKRYEYSKAIISSKILLGKTKKEVKVTLGDEGNADSSNYWHYYIGVAPEFLDIYPDELFIKFDSNKVVTSVEQHGTN